MKKNNNDFAKKIRELEEVVRKFHNEIRRKISKINMAGLDTISRGMEEQERNKK